MVCCCKCTSTRMKGGGICAILTGVALLIVGGVLPQIIANALKSGLDAQLIFGPNNLENRAYKDWLDTRRPGVPEVTVACTWWNWTNPEEWAEGKAKPKLQAVGPYVFTLNRYRWNVTFEDNDDGHSVMSYNEWAYYTWNPQKSGKGLSPHDKLTVVNAVLLGLAATFLHLDADAVYLIWPSDKFTDATRISTTQKVQDLVFGGGDYSPLYSGILENVTSLEEAEKKGRHMTFTGASDNQLVRQYIRWFGDATIKTEANLLPGTPATPTWNTDEANRVGGTDGEIFARGLTKGQTVEAWVDDTMRRTPLVNVDSATVEEDGIELLKFSMGPHLFQNATSHPANAAYNQFGPEGFFNLTRPRGGVPVFVSQPHFFEASPVVANNIDGMQPDRSKHQMYLGVEPTTGITMKAYKRSQVNFKVTPMVFNTTFSNQTQHWFKHTQPHTYIPALWMEESGGITSSLASEFKSQVYFAQRLDRIGIPIILIFGSIVVLIGGCLIHSAPKDDGNDHYRDLDAVNS